MDNWANHIRETLKIKLEGVKDREIRFFRIEEFLRNVHRTEEFSNNCMQCNSNKIEINTIIEKIDEAIKVPGKTRREYDGIIGRLSNHMRKEHNFYPPFHYTYTYSFIGIVLGLIIGFLATLLFPSTNWLILVGCLTIGMIIGNIIGHKKDKKIRNDNRLM